MIPQVGSFVLVLALCLALCQAIIPMLGIWRKDSRLLSAAAVIARGQFLFLLFAFAILTYCFIQNDFSVLYIAQNSNSSLPLMYRISAVWGGHEGSLLLWITLLGAWTCAVSFFSRNLPVDMLARILSVLAWVSVGFLWFILQTSNPFTRILSDIPADGQDLNPLLQDPGLIIHPPMLYMGYVGFAVAFAFAIAALWSGRLDTAWARWSRPWTIVAWLFLTFGILLGSWWAYRELGWGGWWFWDPVENASFLPWLVGTALIHSLMVTEQRGLFKGWTVLLAISAFSLSLLGTFLVRSGVLTSVHSFVSDPARGAFLLKYLFVVIGGALLIYAFRAPAVRSQTTYNVLSRETLILSNNILLSVAMLTILLGTLYPLIIEAVGVGKISVGPPYFNTVFVPIVTITLFLMALGPQSRWRSMPISFITKRLRHTLIISLILGLVLPWALFGRVSGLVVLGMALALWVAIATLQDFIVKVRIMKGPFGIRLRQMPASYYGMMLAHMGVVVCVVGVTLTSAYSVERDVRMQLEDQVMIGPYQFQFSQLKENAGSNYDAIIVSFDVSRNGNLLTTLDAEKRFYRVQRTTMTQAAVDAGITRDLYIALGEPLDNGAWAVRVYYKPFVRWIWLGGILMVLGGVTSVIDKRYRSPKKHKNNKIKENEAK